MGAPCLTKQKFLTSAAVYHKTWVCNSGHLSVTKYSFVAESINSTELLYTGFSLPDLFFTINAKLVSFMWS